MMSSVSETCLVQRERVLVLRTSNFEALPPDFEGTGWMPGQLIPSIPSASPVQSSSRVQRQKELLLEAWWTWQSCGRPRTHEGPVEPGWRGS